MLGKIFFVSLSQKGKVLTFPKISSCIAIRGEGFSAIPFVFYGAKMKVLADPAIFVLCLKVKVLACHTGISSKRTKKH